MKIIPKKANDMMNVGMLEGYGVCIWTTFYFVNEFNCNHADMRGLKIFMCNLLLDPDWPNNFDAALMQFFPLSV